jgi:hypothetical protein
MLLTEAAGYPAVAGLAQSAYERMTEGEQVDYRFLKELIGEASGKGVLRDLRRKYSPTAFDAVIMPILSEIGRQAPVPPRQRPPGQDAGPDPLTAAVWPLAAD